MNAKIIPRGRTWTPDEIGAIRALGIPKADPWPGDHVKIIPARVPKYEAHFLTAGLHVHERALVVGVTQTLPIRLYTLQNKDGEGGPVTVQRDEIYTSVRGEPWVQAHPSG